MSGNILYDLVTYGGLAVGTRHFDGPAVALEEYDRLCSISPGSRN